MNRPPAPIHAVATGGPVRFHDHRALSSCWCNPAMTHRDLATGAAVFIHRDAAVIGCGCSGCAALSPRPAEVTA